MSIRVEVKPKLFEWARERSGIDAERWDLRFPRYDAWLTGASTPTLKQLEDFARKTHTPIGYFFLEEPPVETIPIPDFRTISDRPVASAGAVVSVDLLDVIHACERRQEWYRDNQLLEGELPLTFVGAATMNDAVDDVASEMRDVLGWTAEGRAACRTSDAALTRLRENAEAAGVLVMISGIVGSNTHRTLDPREFRGFALVDRFAPVVFVNGADSKAAQVFTLVHELAHLWLGETGLSDLDPNSIRSNAVERWCNQVAAELLVPMAEFRQRFDSGADLRAQLRPLAEHFRVSSQVVLGRIREAGAVTWSEYLVELEEERHRVAAFLADHGGADHGGGGNYYNTAPVRVSRRFARALIASTLEGHTPYTEAFRLLGLKKAETFEHLAKQLDVA